MLTASSFRGDMPIALRPPPFAGTCQMIYGLLLSWGHAKCFQASSFAGTCYAGELLYGLPAFSGHAIAALRACGVVSLFQLVVQRETSPFAR